MRFSGFSFRLGKRTRLYFSNSKKPSRSAKRKKSPPKKQSASARTTSQPVDYTPSMAVGIFFVGLGAICLALGLFFVMAAFAHTGLSRIFAVVVAVLALAMGMSFVFGARAEIKRAKAHKAEMAAAAEARASYMAMLKSVTTQTTAEAPSAAGNGAHDYEYTTVGIYRPEGVTFMPAVGDAVTLELEPDNPYDDKAVVAKVKGERIGYLNRGKLKDMVVDFLDSSSAYIVAEVTRADSKVEIWIGMDR